MKKMSFKSIFNWLYGAMLDRAMSERKPREDRETISSVYRLVSVSYVSAFLSSMCSQWGLLALARRIYSSKDNSVCLSRCGWSASRISLVALLLLFVGSWNSEVWATWPTYSGTITNSGGTYYVLNEGDGGVELMDGGSRTYDKTYNLGGPCSTLSFQLKKVNYVPTGSVYVYAGSSEVYSVGVGDFASKNNWKTFPDNPKDISSYCKNTTLRFHATGTLGKWLRYAKVTMFSGTLDPSSSSVEFGAADYNTTGSTSAYTQNFTIDWSNMSAMSISGLNNTQFSATISNNSSAGKYGTATVTVTYKHDKVGTHNATLTIGGKSVSLSGTTNKITPYVVTTPTVDPITYGQTISNSQLGTGLVKADLINAAGTVVPGTWTIDENGQTVTTSGGSNATVHLTFTPTDGNTYNTIHTTQLMFVRSAATITWASAYSATKPTIPVGKTIEIAATTTAAGATITYSTSNDKIIIIENEGTTFRAIAEGEATITASHGVTATHGSASISKTFKTTYKDIQVIVWKDRFDRLTTEMTSKNLLAQVWIENPSTGVRTYSAARTALLEYSVEDNTVVSIPNNSTTLTIHKKGNTTITASVEGDDQYEEASVTMPVKVREPSEGCDDPIILKEENNGSSDYLYRLFSDDTKKPALYTDEYAINVAQGRVPDKLSFGHKGAEYKVMGLSFWTYYSGTINAQQKVNGQWIDVENSSVTPEKEKWNTKDGLQLDERATHIRFCRPQGGEGYHYVNNVEVTMKHFIRTATPTVDFGNTIKVNSSEYQDVVVKYSNVKGALQVVNPFTSDVTVQVVNPFMSDVTVSDEIIDIEECGAFGSATLRISFSPTTATGIDDYIVVKDPVVGNSSALSIRVKADVQRADQTIKWNPATSISTIDQILLNGTTNGQEYGQMNVIGYEVTNNDGVISVTNNVVTILKPGTVTITASQLGTANYDVAEPVEKNFTISAEPLTLVAPTAQGITYGQALSESELSGGSAKDSKGNDVGGTFAWQSPDAELNAGDNQTPTVVFTPSTNAAWYTNLTTTANINVAKADPVVTVENVSFAYGTKAEEVALDGTGDGEWSWTDSRKGQVLAVDTYEMDVHFAPTDDANYNAIDKKITLTVTKVDPAATVENVSFAYGTKAEEVALDGTGDGEWSWTDSRKGQVLAVDTYEMDVHFAPTDDANYNAIDKKITLTVTKVDPAATVENVSFAYGTKAEDVALSGTGAGTWTWTDSRKGQVLAVDTYEMDVHFAPTDDANYNAIDKKITLTVTKADPVVTVENVSFAYGTKAEEVALDGTGDGEWSWTDSRKGQVLAVDTYEMDVHFAPTDDANYNAIDKKITLTVTKANPVATANAVEITYGATAASVDLEGTGLAGEWTWTDSRKDDVLAAGEYTMTVHFVPTDAVNYNEKDATVTLTVNKAPSVATPSAAAITAGQKVIESALTNSGTEGTWLWDDAVKNTTPAAGTYNYTVHFTPDNDNYTTLTTTVNLKVNALVNEFTNAAGDGDWRDPANWSNGVPSGSEPNVIINGDLIIDSVLTVGNLTIEKNSRVVLTVNGDLTVNGTSEDRTEYGNLYVENGGEVEINGGLQVGDLTVEASIGTADGTAESGQVDKAENIVYANAYIEINMDARGTLDDTKWYGFTVPFDVDARTGISRKENGVYRQCTYGTHYMIAEYDANKRLTTGKGWKYITGNTLHAGTFYYLTVDGNYNTYRFKAKEAAYTQAAPATLAMNGSTSNPNANWNAVGNSTLQHAKVSFDGGNYVQVYENGLDAYRTVSANEATFVVGCPFFIQAKEASTVVLDAPTSATKYYYAPRRSSAAQGGVARVNLTSVEGGYSDQIYVSGTEKEEDAYITGRDLAKAGESKVVPQLWVDAYNQKLSVHEAAWQGENAICPLGIYAPKDGEYILTATQPENGTQVYLTIDGMPVWNISEADYVLSLEKGTMNNYGLMLIQASRMPTDVENVEAADGEKTQKIILNDHLYILRDSRMYDVTGKKVK